MVTIPTNWKMYTHRGNRSITSKAIRFVEKLDEAESFDASKKYKRKVDLVIQFLNQIQKLSETKHYDEVIDTAVKDTIWSFFKTVCKEYSINAQEAWNNTWRI